MPDDETKEQPHSMQITPDTVVQFPKRTRSLSNDDRDPTAVIKSLRDAALAGRTSVVWHDTRGAFHELPSAVLVYWIDRALENTEADH